MKYLSLDIETTGLDPYTCDILEIGAYLEDTNNPLPREQLPKFHRYIWEDNYRGEPYALNMNQKIFQTILELRKRFLKGETKLEIAEPMEVVEHFEQFLIDIGLEDAKIVLAGKNIAGFDIPFLNQLPCWKGRFKFYHRVIDPGMLYFDPRIDDVPPDMKECKKRAGLIEHVSHEALDDAWDVIKLIRVKYGIHTIPYGE